MTSTDILIPSLESRGYGARSLAVMSLLLLDVPTPWWSSEFSLCEWPKTAYRYHYPHRMTRFSCTSLLPLNSYLISTTLNKSHIVDLTLFIMNLSNSFAFNYLHRLCLYIHPVDAASSTSIPWAKKFLWSDRLVSSSPSTYPDDS